LADNPVTLPELEKALDELIMQENSIDLQPGDITINSLAKRSGWNRSRAETVISEWVASGVLETLGQRREPERGQKVAAWRLKGNE
jgi:predicted HTH transcriptional regulator